MRSASFPSRFLGLLFLLQWMAGPLAPAALAAEDDDGATFLAAFTKTEQAYEAALPASGKIMAYCAPANVMTIDLVRWARKSSPEELLPLVRVEVAYFKASLDRVRASIDPQFDPTVYPRINIAPPSGRYMGGIAPSAVTDPEERAAYEALLEKNRNYIAYFNVEYKKVEVLAGMTRWYGEIILRDRLLKETPLTHDQAAAMLGDDVSGKALRAAMDLPAPPKEN